MSDQGNWISLQRAVAAIHEVMAGAPGPVYQTLVNLCADGLVRARWTEHASKTQPAIPRRVWIGASIDWSSPSGRVDKADGNGMAGVDFSEADLNDWAKSLSTNAIKAMNNEAEQAAETSVVPKPSGVPTNKQAALKAKCSAWIAALPERPARRKDDLRAEAMTAFPGLSGRQFDRAWDDDAPDSWKVPGPK
jgi:hypothetical protein